MSSALYALGRWAFRARRRVLVLWIVALAVLFAGVGLLSEGTDNTYSIPGTESQDALDALARTFPQVSGTSAQLIAVAPEGGDVTEAAFESAVEDAITAITAIPQVTSAASPYESTPSANLSPDGSAALVPIQLSVGTTAVLPSTSEALQAAGAALEAALPEGSQVSVGGQLFSQSATGISITELLGIVIAYFVLLVAFASFVAAGLPLITALLGVGASLSVVLIGTRFLTITSTTPLLALMLGLAVGIDYALFIISRHQDQLKRGIEPEESAAQAVATSGSAVVFAAITVIIALVGLSVAGIPFLSIMGIAAALAVAVAVLISITLTPALLGFAGWRVVAKRHRPGVPVETERADVPAEAEAGTEVATGAESGPEAPDADESDPSDPEASDDPRPGRFFLGWVRAVTRWPIVTVVVIVALLALAAVPAAGLRLTLPDAGTLEEGTPGRVTYDLIADHFGPGFNGPLIVTGSVIESTDPVGLMDDLGAEIADVRGVASVPLSTPNETGDTGIVQVIPDGAPDSEQTKQLVSTLRSMHDVFEREYGVDLSVTGYTAAGIDISDRLAGALLPFGLLVVGLSLVLLAMVFRSIVVPVTAALGYALSIGAAFGLTALVFVHGVGADALNVASVGSVISFMPIILMGVLFGLAMDYEVFLVSRMREDFVHHGESRRAVEQGFVGSARVVTAAAIIMFSVFAAFVPEGDASIQPIAFGLAVGVAIDAFLVRMTLIPAVLVLFGAGAWWIPSWLDRALPRFDIEGEALAAEFELAEWPSPDATFAIAAEGVRVGGDGAGIAPIDAMVGVGEALVVHGGSPIDRSSLLLALGGRAAVTAGRLKVDGLVVPARASTVRTRTAYVRLEHASTAREAIHDGLASGARIVQIDAADGIDVTAAARDIRSLLSAARDATGLTIVVAAGDESSARALVPEEAVVHTLTLASATRARAMAGVR
ncbi:MMPL family transporter [Agromyces sp. SYSU K20354]|uniref:MMPL family transporter n=1 Tax=Agromyces cavernae TaxID=2898659 RepID=UPI001E607ED6|nr:MMPL family transporter [Agromyces cavernae]MCD2443140.1 MMPL family transporter [Agromyces cavernae]